MQDPLAWALLHERLVEGKQFGCQRQVIENK
jgi:hypothetical protein